MVKKVETKEVNSNIDVEELREDLKTYIDKQVKKSWTEEVERSNKRLLREKNRKIIIRDIIIIILLAGIGFSVYKLYKLDFFDKYFNHGTVEPEKKKENNKEDEPKKEEEVLPTLDELKEEYAYLLDKIYISENSSYLGDYYDGKLTSELKNYLAFNNVDFDDLAVEDDYNVIDEDTIINSYYDLFTDDYESNSFDYNGNKVRYINKLQYYITDKVLEKESSNINREITDIKVDGDTVVITTIEGLVKNNKLYNILNEKEVKNYKGNSLSKYSDKLNERIYTFNNEKLVSIK